MLGALSKACTIRVTITEPPSVTSAKIELSKATRLKSTNGPYDWTGPDADVGIRCLINLTDFPIQIK